MKEKEKDLIFIKSFSKITITGICKNLKITRQNVLNGKTSEQNIKKVKEKIQEEYAKLFINGV